MNDPEPTVPGPTLSVVGEDGPEQVVHEVAEQLGMIAKLKAKLNNDAQRPPMRLGTTAQLAAEGAPRWTRAEYERRRKRQKSAAASSRRPKKHARSRAHRGHGK